jgi:hypothetical protein
MQPFLLQWSVKKLHPISWLIMWAQITVFLVVLYILWWLLSPNAHLTFFPAHSLENVVYNFLFYPTTYDTSWEKRNNIPLVYTTGSFLHTETISLPVNNITYEITDARLEVALQNTLPTDYSFLANTIFTTKDGRLFSTPEEIFLPAASPDGSSWVVILTLTALPFQDNGLPIGDRGNLLPTETLYIQKFDESMKNERIIALPIRILNQGSTIEKGIVQDTDIFNLEVRIRSSLEQRMKALIFQHFKDSPYIVIPFTDMMWVSLLSWNTEQLPWTQATRIIGTIQAELRYAIIEKKQLLTNVLAYIQARPQQHLTFSHIDYSRVTFLAKRADPDIPSRMLVPLVLPIVWRYSLDHHQRMLDDLAHKVLWTTKETAKKIILQNPAIGDVDIRLRPPRYGVLPVVPSRITHSISTTSSRNTPY